MYCFVLSLQQNSKLKTMEEHITIIVNRDEFGSMIQEAVRSAFLDQMPPTEPKMHIKGTHQLAKFLGISVSKAQRLKNEGIIPFFQNERLVLFDPDRVKEALANYNKRKTK